MSGADGQELQNDQSAPHESTPTTQDATADPSPSSADVTSTNPAAIVSLADALRYINERVRSDTTTVARIRKLRKHQDDHEVQWYAGREELVEKYKQRRENRTKVASLLSNAGGNTAVPTPSEAQDVAEELEELQQYDRKVYNASLALVMSMSRELAALQIPFFCNDSSTDRADLLQCRALVIEALESISNDEQ
ncbi:uncharacterized protein V1518DRAFT_416826 [Limtongia smithiae]|uniref:uncharacterized protein n=1 Tax=Limtongia smithiae TaxID=1125753 RepID=UPI0034CF42E5